MTSSRQAHEIPQSPEGDGEPQYASKTPWVAFMRRHIWAVAVVFGVVMITGLRSPLIRRPDAPEVLAELVDAQLVDQNDAPFSLASMRGRVWVVGMIFTRCPTVCPRVTQSMVELQQDIVRSKIADRVSLLTVTVDPDYDTPAVLREYAARIGADTESWSFVTGPKSEITRFVVEGFKSAVGDRREISPGVFDIAHSTRLAVVDAAGGIRGFYSADADWNEDRHRLYHGLFPIMRLEPKP